MHRTQRRLLIATGLLLAATSHAADQDTLVATLITAATVDETVRMAPADSVSDQQIRHVEAPDTNIGVGIVHRPALKDGDAFQVISHHRQSEVYRVISGSGTLVTTTSLHDEQEIDPEGWIVRTLTGPSSNATAGEPQQRRKISAGDVVIIPAGVAHGFSEIVGEITYLVVRIDPDRLVELK
jgi:mannose-6-phosphate isomerase-like protein (cupin superfamily)